MEVFSKVAGHPLHRRARRSSIICSHSVACLTAPDIVRSAGSTNDVQVAPGNQNMEPQLGGNCSVNVTTSASGAIETGKPCRKIQVGTERIAKCTTGVKVKREVSLSRLNLCRMFRKSCSTGAKQRPLRTYADALCGRETVDEEVVFLEDVHSVPEFYYHWNWPSLRWSCEDEIGYVKLRMFDWELLPIPFLESVIPLPTDILNVVYSFFKPKQRKRKERDRREEEEGDYIVYGDYHPVPAVWRRLPPGVVAFLNGRNGEWTNGDDFGDRGPRGSRKVNKFDDKSSSLKNMVKECEIKTHGNSGECRKLIAHRRDAKAGAERRIAEKKKESKGVPVKFLVPCPTPQDCRCDKKIYHPSTSEKRAIFCAMCEDVDLLEYALKVTGGRDFLEDAYDEGTITDGAIEKEWARYGTTGQIVEESLRIFGMKEPGESRSVVNNALTTEKVPEKSENADDTNEKDSTHDVDEDEVPLDPPPIDLKPPREPAIPAHIGINIPAQPRPPEVLPPPYNHVNMLDPLPPRPQPPPVFIPTDRGEDIKPDPFEGRGFLPNESVSTVQIGLRLSDGSKREKNLLRLALSNLVKYAFTVKAGSRTKCADMQMCTVTDAEIRHQSWFRKIICGVVKGVIATATPLSLAFYSFGGYGLSPRFAKFISFLDGKDEYGDYNEQVVDLLSGLYNKNETVEIFPVLLSELYKVVPQGGAVGSTTDTKKVFEHLPAKLFERVFDIANSKNALAYNEFANSTIVLNTICHLAQVMVIMVNKQAACLPSETLSASVIRR